MKTNAAVTMLLATAAFVSSCSQSCDGGDAPKASASAAPPPIEVGKGKRTTPADVAVANLQGRIKASEKSLEVGRDKIQPRQWLLETLLERATSLGRVSDYDRIGELESELATLRSKDADVLVQRATALSAVHRFEEALRLLEEAEAAGARKAVLEVKRASVYLAQGKYEEACPLFEAAAKAPKAQIAMTLAGVCISQLGRIEEADKLMAEAESTYVDVSPFMLAWIWFERGSMWEKNGDEEKAKALYRASLERLPGYAHAAAHLAQLVPPGDAEAILRPALEIGDDPELEAILGVAKNEVSAGSGKEHIEKAKSRYAELLGKHPLAFADHAGWFFLKAADDPAKAAEVARLNLKNRQTHEAYELALAALPAAGSSAEACEAADKALERKWVPPALKELAAKAYEACGKPDQAAKARAR